MKKYLPQHIILKSENFKLVMKEISGDLKCLDKGISLLQFAQRTDRLCKNLTESIQVVTSNLWFEVIILKIFLARIH